MWPASHSSGARHGSRGESERWARRSFRFGLQLDGELGIDEIVLDTSIQARREGRIRHESQMRVDDLRLRLADFSEHTVANSFELGNRPLDGEEPMITLPVER
jgi:hypothetical protein